MMHILVCTYWEQGQIQEFSMGGGTNTFSEESASTWASTHLRHPVKAPSLYENKGEVHAGGAP